MSIHPTALIDPGAQLGADVEVGPFAIIGDGRRRVPDGTLAPMKSTSFAHRKAVVAGDAS